jgi:hypothetical protein
MDTRKEPEDPMRLRKAWRFRPDKDMIVAIAQFSALDIIRKKVLAKTGQRR